MLLNFRFHVLKFFRGCDFRQSPEKHFVCSLPFHHFQAIQYLAMRRSLLNRENHRFPKPALRAILSQNAQPAVHFHCLPCEAFAYFNHG